MIKIENVVTPSNEQWEAILKGMRNPLDSWNRADSDFKDSVDIGENDLNLMNKLSSWGADHSKYMRMLNVVMDINAPLYWWKEFDTYKVGTVANSRSTMHKIQANRFTRMDFSFERVIGSQEWCLLDDIITLLNSNRIKFLETKDKQYWENMIQILPSSYNQLRTVSVNYQVLKNMYHNRKNHKLQEWRDFCKMIETLPYSEVITNKTIGYTQK